MYSLRHYERLTSGTVNMYELPNIQELGKKRIERARNEIAKVVESKDLASMREIIEAMASESELSMLDLAAALLFQKQLKQPLQPKEDPKPRRDARDSNRERNGRDRNDRGRDSRRGSRDESRADSRGDRNGNRGSRDDKPRKAKANRNDVDWQTYRLEVGKEHGARPGDIVGAIANEISLDSSYIGAINLHEKHSFVQLPKGIPADLFKQLKGVRVRRQPLAITASEEQMVKQESRRRTERPQRHN